MKCSALLLLVTSLPISSMQNFYQLHPKQTITDRLNKAELHHFASETKIADTLGGTFINPISLHNYLCNVVEKYNSTTTQWVQKDYKKGLYNSQKPTVAAIMPLLLQNHPRAIIALEKNYDGAFLK